MAWIPAAIGGVAALASGFLGARASRKAAKKQREGSLELAEYAHSKDLEMWHRMNEYNTPAAQMDRFKNAGLNPNLIYGQGTPGQAQQMPQYQAPQMEYDYSPLIDPLSVLQAHTDMAMKTRQIKHEERKAETEFFRKWLVQTQQSNLLSQTAINSLQAEYLQETMLGRIDAVGLQNIYQKSMNIINKKYAEWAQAGINPRDATWLRMTIEMLDAFGVNTKSMRKRIDNLNY